jgi:outer membrane protein assembly factor BamB
MRSILLFAPVGFLIATFSIAADWPMGGRSANRNPVSLEKTPPLDWQFGGEVVKTRNIHWAASVGSRAAGGPIISGGLVWVGSNNDYRDEDRPDRAVLSCFRESDGKLLYRYQSKRRNDSTDWPKQSLTGSPAAEGDRLWFINNRREVVCLDTAPLRLGKGAPRIVWTLDMVDALKVNPRALMIPWADTLGSPATYGEFLYVPTGNARTAWDDNPPVPAPDAPSLVCLRKDTGKVVWTDNSPGKSLLYGQCASPLVIEIAGRVQIIHPQADGWVRAFEAKTGKLLWKFDVNRKAAKGDRALGADGERVAVLGTPVFSGGRLFFATGVHPEAGGGQGCLYSIDPTKTGDVSPELEVKPGQGKPNPNSAVVWSFTQEGPAESDKMHFAISSIAVYDGLVFAVDFSGYVHCVAAKTGKQQWSHNVRGAVYACPLVVGGKLYVATENGDVWVLDAAATKHVHRKIEADNFITAGPVFANGVLYVLTGRWLYAVAPAPEKR